MKFIILGCGSSMGVPRADGFFGNSNNSEFAGHDFKKQFIKLSEGKKILEKEE